MTLWHRPSRVATGFQVNFHYGSRSFHLVQFPDMSANDIIKYVPKVLALGTRLVSMLGIQIASTEVYKCLQLMEEKEMYYWALEIYKSQPYCIHITTKGKNVNKWYTSPPTFGWSPTWVDFSYLYSQEWHAEGWEVDITTCGRQPNWRKLF